MNLLEMHPIIAKQKKSSSGSASRDDPSEQDDFFASLESELDSMLSDDTK